MNTAHLPDSGQGLARASAMLRCIASTARTIGAAAVFYAASCGAAAGNDAQAKKEIEAKLDTRGTITLRDTTVANWLFAIQENWKVDIVFGNELQNEVVNGAFGEDNTLREILDVILGSRNYGYQRIGRSLVIKSLDEIGSLNPRFTGELLRYEYLNSTEAEESVRLFLSPHGRVQQVASSKSLFVSDLPELVEKIRSHLQKLDNNAREVIRPAAGAGTASDSTAADHAAENSNGQRANRCGKWRAHG